MLYKQPLIHLSSADLKLSLRFSFSHLNIIMKVNLVKGSQSNECFSFWLYENLEQNYIIFSCRNKVFKTYYKPSINDFLSRFMKT